jgi:two-component system, chemotaxis family, protein-glutamate methylesterase/glutaminase
MTNENPLRVLVVDDTVIYRKIVSDVLAEVPGVEVVGTAFNGKSAMARIASLKPDLLTLDIEMPEMNGIETLERLQTAAPDVGAIMLSSLTREGGEMTMKALALGAFDFIPKPQHGSMEENMQAVREALVPMLKAFSRHREIKGILRGKQGVGAKSLYPGKATAYTGRSAVMGRKEKAAVIGIGISTGGPNALAKMMPKLPDNLNVPIVIVQHMPPVFTQSLAKSLDAKCAITVKEAVDGEPLQPNTAYIAPGGYQMKIAAGADGKNRVIRVTDDPPENSCKPAVDYLFRSIAHHYVGRSTGVIMTGMGSDGTLGLKLMKRNGSTVIAQSEETCVVFGMPKAPIESGIVDTVAPLEHIAEEICRTVKK